MGRKKSALVTWIERIIIIVLLIIAVQRVKDYLFPEAIDVTGMVNMTTEELEVALGTSLTQNSDMAQRINHYSRDEIITNSTDGIGVIYIRSRQKGLHIDSRKYSMYGLHLGDSETDVEEKITYKYEDRFTRMTGDVKGSSNSIFYYNKKNNDCLVVIYNNYTGKAVAITYFNDLKKMTERAGIF